MANPAYKARLGRRDANHGEIQEALEAIGCGVLDTSSLGGGKPDMIACRIMLNGALMVRFLEIKVPGGVVSQRQRDFHKRWPAPIDIVKSPAEAVALFLDGVAHPSGARE